MKAIIIAIVAFLFGIIQGASAQAKTPVCRSLDNESLHYAAANVYGEGYLEGKAGWTPILEVMENRAHQSGKSLKEIVLAPMQFSAWNAGEPSAVLLRDLAEGRSSENELIDEAFAEVLAHVREKLCDVNRQRILARSVRHYWAHDTMTEPPYWYNGEPIVVIGGHTFADGIR